MQIWAVICPGEYFQIRRSGGGGGGGLGPHIKFRGRVWGKVWPSSPNKRKTWEVLSRQDAKVRKSPNFGVISEIQRTKFGVFVIIFLEAKYGAPTRISEANFGAKPPNILIWKYPLG